MNMTVRGSYLFLLLMFYVCCAYANSPEINPGKTGEEREKEYWIKAFTFDGEEATEENYLKELTRILKPGIPEAMKHIAALNLLSNSEAAKEIIIGCLNDPDKSKWHANYIMWLAKMNHLDDAEQFAPILLNKSEANLQAKISFISMFIPRDVPEQAISLNFIVNGELIISALLSDPNTSNCRNLALEILDGIQQKKICIRDHLGSITPEKIFDEVSLRLKNLHKLAFVKFGFTLHEHTTAPVAPENDQNKE